MVLDSLLATMKAHGARRVRLADGTEAELHESVFATVASFTTSPEAPQRDVDRCDCTHSLSVEHNEAGCLRGCDAALCAKTGAPVVSP